MGNQSGRSMIEMLGVLAIVGILSVGGIIGYSKAMTKYRINKWTEEMTFVLQNFITYKKDWMQIAQKQGLINITKYMRNMGIFPMGWKEYTENELYDSFGSLIVFAAYPDAIFFRTKIKTEHTEFTQICLQYWVNIIIPYSEYIYYVHMYGTEKDSGGRNEENKYYGNIYCTQDKKCIRNLQISDIVAKCIKAEKNDSTSISVYFK
ncbi:MAG: type II secretion system GspH family protein [Acetobacter sp.]|nr:type II secretion system GspH family protein [Acetobacter sp.]